MANYLLQEVNHWENGGDYILEEGAKVIHSLRSPVAIILNPENVKAFDGKVFEAGAHVGVKVGKFGFVSSYFPDTGKTVDEFWGACDDARLVIRQLRDVGAEKIIW